MNANGGPIVLTSCDLVAVLKPCSIAKRLISLRVRPAVFTKSIDEFGPPQ